MTLNMVMHNLQVYVKDGKKVKKVMFGASMADGKWEKINSFIKARHSQDNDIKKEMSKRQDNLKVWSCTC